MTSDELRSKFLKFFEERGHKVIPSASLVPSDYGDNGTLFTSAGMQPLIPYLLGKAHPEGHRLADVQKCVRTGDIDEVGDNRHLTFFEMLGNWSLGDYFKKESLEWSFDFLTNKEYGLGLDPARFYVTVFRGEQDIPRDKESIKIWQEIFTKYGLSNGVAEEDIIREGVRIIPLGTNDNFWIAGALATATGPCGADSEIFYDTKPHEGAIGGKFDDLVNSFRLIEVWNNVFMEFNKTPAGPGRAGNYEPLAAKNVDTGMGLERTLAVINETEVFSTDLFLPIIAKIDELSGHSPDLRAKRIIADHLRTAVFMIADGVTPLNTGRGYVLRRIIRRAVRYTDQINLTPNASQEIVSVIIEKYKNCYPELEKNKEKIFSELTQEEEKFRKTLKKALEVLGKEIKAQIYTPGKQYEPQPVRIIEGPDNIKMWDFKPHRVTGKWLFNFYQTFGFPPEMVLEELKTKGDFFSQKDYEKLYTEFGEEMKSHQEVSKVGSEQKFKGGLAGTGEMETKYHTATHLLLASLRQVLGQEITQKGSNITTERLRFDFNWPEKLTPEQLKNVEDLVNQKISEKMPVFCEEMSLEEAKKIGATGSFENKYGEIVKIYSIGSPSTSSGPAFSREFCGGPHVANTGDLGHFHIAKEEASSAGIRRIKAVLE